MAKKKSYNPLKMWGAWVGGIIGSLIIPLSIYMLIAITLSSFGSPIPFWQVPFMSTESFFVSLGTMIGGFIIGFLIGWGIHSLVRRFRK